MTLTAINSDNYATPAGFAADPVILTVHDNNLSVLLVDSPVEGRKGLPGGFVGETENAKETAERKLFIKTGVENVYLEELATYSDPNRDSRGRIISNAFLSLIPSSQLPDNSNAEWFPVNDLPTMAFDHKDMVEAAVNRLKGKLWYSNVASGLLPEVFSAGQARKVYQLISGVEYDPANFSRDLKSLGLVEEVNQTVQAGKGRPGKGLRFVSSEPSWAKTYGRKTDVGEA